MASEIRVNKINSRTGVGTITLSPTGVDFTGIATVATLKATTGIVTTLTVTGDVGIATGSPSAPLHVNAGTTNNALFVDSSDSEVSLGLAASDGAVRLLQSSGGLVIRTNGNANAFGTGDSEAARIDSSGRLLVGTTTEGIASGDNLTIADSGNCGLTIRSGTSSQGNIFFSDGTSGNSEYDGFIQYQQNNQAMLFGAGGGTERLRIDSSGDVRLEHKVRFQYNTGSTDSRTWLVQNDLHAYGDLGFRRSTTQTGNTFETKILFKDDGGICFNGDTAAANALDDYEEGTFTATCDNSITLDSTADLLQYVKIGASVTVMGQIRVNSSNSGSSLTINNLPFTVFSSGEASSYAVGAVRLYSADMASDHKYIVAIADGGSTNLTFQGVRDNNTSQGLGATDNGYYMFSVTYRTTT